MAGFEHGYRKIFELENGHARRLRGVNVARRARNEASCTETQTSPPKGEGGRDRRVRGAGAIFKRKKIGAGLRRNVTRIREPVDCEPMECCPMSVERRASVDTKVVCAAKTSWS
jgi:hypothetical protein